MPAKRPSPLSTESRDPANLNTNRKHASILSEADQVQMLKIRDYHATLPSLENRSSQRKEYNYEVEL